MFATTVGEAEEEEESKASEIWQEHREISTSANYNGGKKEAFVFYTHQLPSY